jgi:hypothetical protein
MHFNFVSRFARFFGAPSDADRDRKVSASRHHTTGLRSVLAIAVIAVVAVASCVAALTSGGRKHQNPDAGVGLTSVRVRGISPGMTPRHSRSVVRCCPGPQDWWTGAIASTNADLDAMTVQALRAQAGYVGWLTDLSIIAAAAASQPSGGAHYTRGGSTGACGGASNGADQYIGRESGGDPSAANASGAYGCYQIMPGTWAASCSDLGPEGGSSAGTQAQCASRLPLGSWGG